MAKETAAQEQRQPAGLLTPTRSGGDVVTKTHPLQCLTPQEVSGLLRLSLKEVRRIYKTEGLLPYQKFGTCVRIKQTDLEALMEACRHEAHNELATLVFGGGGRQWQ